MTLREYERIVDAHQLKTRVLYDKRGYFKDVISEDKWPEPDDREVQYQSGINEKVPKGFYEADKMAFYEIITGYDFRSEEIPEEDKYSIMNYIVYLLECEGFDLGEYPFITGNDMVSVDLCIDISEFTDWEAVPEAKNYILNYNEKAIIIIKRLANCAQGYKFTKLSMAEYLKLIALINSYTNMPCGLGLSNIQTLEKLKEECLGIDEKSCQFALRAQRHYKGQL